MTIWSISVFQRSDNLKKFVAAFLPPTLPSPSQGTVQRGDTITFTSSVLGDSNVKVSVPSALFEGGITEVEATRSGNSYMVAADPSSTTQYTIRLAAPPIACVPGDGKITVGQKPTF